MNKDIKNTKNIFEYREATLLVALENIKQRSLSELYQSEKDAVDIIREATDLELLELELKRIIKC